MILILEVDKEGVCGLVHWGPIFFSEYWWKDFQQYAIEQTLNKYPDKVDSIPRVEAWLDSREGFLLV